MELNITDLLGRSVDGKHWPVGILLHLTRTSPLIRQLTESQMDGYGIYRVKVPPQLEDYVALGDLFLADNWQHLSVPLVHSKHSKVRVVDRYKQTTDIMGGHLWKPDISDDLVYIGTRYSPAGGEPVLPTAVLDKSLVFVSSIQLNSVGALNEFKLIGSEGNKMRALNRLEIIRQPFASIAFANPDTETLSDNEWDQIEGKHVVLSVPKNPWFDDKPDLPPEPIPVPAPSNRPTTQNNQAKPSEITPSVDYFGVSLTIITAIVVVYHLSSYITSRFQSSTESGQLGTS